MGEGPPRSACRGRSQTARCCCDSKGHGGEQLWKRRCARGRQVSVEKVNESEPLNSDRREAHARTQFTFLGYTFRPRGRRTAMDELLWSLLQISTAQSLRSLRSGFRRGGVQEALAARRPQLHVAMASWQKTATLVCPLARLWSRWRSGDGGRVNREVHARFCQRLEGILPAC